MGGGGEPGHSRLVVPARAVQEEAADEHPVLGRLGRLRRQVDKVERQPVDRQHIFAREVLHGAREKGVREVESREPEDARLAVVVPGLSV